MSTFVLQSDGVTDAEIISGSPTTARGLGTVLSLGQRDDDADYKIGRSVIKFANLSNGGVPKNRAVVSATLSLYLTTDRCNYSRTYSWFRLKNDFVESEVTWRIRKTGVNWAVQGIYSASNSTDYERADPIATITLAASEAAGWKTWNLNTTKIFEMINGIWVNNGFFGMCDAEYNDQYFFRSNNHATVNTRPKLTVVVDDAVSGEEGIL